MSKDLEKEYKALIDSEAPDLWARIESELQETEKPARQRKQHIIPWAGLVAACACVALCILVLKSRSPFDGSNSYTTAQNRKDLAFNLASDTGALECAPEEAALTDGAAAGGADEAVPKSCDQPAAMNGADYSAVEDAVDGRDTVTSAGIFMDDDIEEASAQEIRRITVTAEILDIDLRMNSGILYLAKVVSSEETSVQAGSEIKIFCSALAAKDMISLEQSQTYEMTLIKGETQSEGDGMIYTLQSAVKP